MKTLAVLALIALPTTVLAGDKKEQAGKTTLGAFLKKTHPDKTWQVGPMRLDTPEIKQAYPGKEAWFVHSSPPLPPGAPLPELLKAYQERLTEYLKKMISVSALIDKEGGVHVVQKPADFNAGLMPVASEEDAKTAAAAILSLSGQGQTGPGAVGAKEVSVKKEDAGWMCTVSRKLAFQGEVRFDAKGRCTAVSKTFTGPVPP